MGVGRDLRAAVFGRVQTFSAREMNRFGTASLITRNTNDVQQIQLFLQIALTMLVTRADHRRRRRDHGAARGRAALALLLVVVVR